jgi:hypothetical protein
MVLKTRRRKYEHDAARLDTSVLQVHPGVCGNERHSSSSEIAFVVANLNMSHSRLDQHNLILTEMFMSRDDVTREKVFGSQHQVLGTVVFRADLQ